MDDKNRLSVSAAANANGHMSSAAFHEPRSVPAFHNTPPAPNNNIAITLNHTVLSQPAVRETLELGE